MPVPEAPTMPMILTASDIEVEILDDDPIGEANRQSVHRQKDVLIWHSVLSW